MRIAELRRGLERELTRTETLAFFQDVKTRIEAISSFDDLHSLLAVLRDRRLRGYHEQNKILRAIVQDLHAPDHQNFWLTVLAFAFFPSMLDTYGRTVRGNNDPDELVSHLLFGFVEKAAAEGVADASSVASTLRWGAHQNYFRAIKHEQKRRKREVPLKRYSQPQRLTVDIAGRPIGSEADELAEDTRQIDLNVLRHLLSEETLSPEDRDLVWATSAEGRTIRQFMKERGLSSDSEDTNGRMFQRLKKRRQRALQKLRERIERSRKARARPVP